MVEFQLGVLPHSSALGQFLLDLASTNTLTSTPDLAILALTSPFVHLKHRPVSQSRPIRSGGNPAD